jgi:hypothetical protein
MTSALICSALVTLMPLFVGSSEQITTGASPMASPSPSGRYIRIRQLPLQGVG